MQKIDSLPRVGFFATINSCKWSAFLKPSDEIIGNCGIYFDQQRKDVCHGKAFVALMIDKRRVGKGYATDVVQTLLNDVMKNAVLRSLKKERLPRDPAWMEM